MNWALVGAHNSAGQSLAAAPDVNAGVGAIAALSGQNPHTVLRQPGEDLISVVAETGAAALGQGVKAVRAAALSGQRKTVTDGETG